MSDSYHIKPVGIIRKKEDESWIEVFDEFSEALLGLDGFSHIYIFYWFHQNDSADKRKTLQVRPRKDPENPLTGVFATHSPLRPNLIALSLCRLESIAGNQIRIEEIDAYDGSPVIDIKCYIPGAVPDTDLRLPEWV